jgi:type I restriction enzyme S subunit
MALAGQGKTKGMVAQVAFPTTSNQSMAAIVPSASLKARYLFWWLDSNYESIRNMAGGDLRDGLNLELLGNIDCPTPPPAEQQAIADFLDRETAKIDALVAEQERLIELLKEKRQAVISHAVTKGLDPSVPMKYSGVEWIGEIPAHWQVARVKTLSTFTTSGPRGWGERLGTEGALFVQSGDVNDRLSVDYAGCNRVAVDEGAEAARTRVEAGDILVCITGAKTGNVGVCLAPPTAAYVNQHLCLIRPNAEALPGFLGLALKSHVGQLHFALSQYGLKQGLSLEDVRECRATMPPTAEQSTLLTIIAVKTAQLDELCETSERSIALLQERRAALISAAVTGQIDVRGAAA